MPCQSSFGERLVQVLWSRGSRNITIDALLNGFPFQATNADLKAHAQYGTAADTELVIPRSFQTIQFRIRNIRREDHHVRESESPVVMISVRG